MADPQLHMSMLVVALVMPRSNSGARYHSEEELVGSSISETELSIGRAELKLANFTSPLHSNRTTLVSSTASNRMSYHPKLHCCTSE